ncbi:hypothetical protein ACFYY8_36625 [Streptosporangium sp. NPDC001559]|uniref:hypothetical protein n=1 Tax=Streptosporangium sp. NPDC001559 TaxID=3366187 RepID=UPI0036EA7A1E
MTRHWRPLARRARRVRFSVTALSALALATVLAGHTRGWWVNPSLPTTVPALSGEREECPDPRRDRPVGTVLCTGLTLRLTSDNGVVTIARAATEISGIDGDPDMVEFAISRDGHRVAYLDAQSYRFVAMDLPTGKTRALTPPLSGEELGKWTDLTVSPDGRSFAVSLQGYPKTILTDFETGRTREIPGVCVVHGLTATAVVGNRWCRHGGLGRPNRLFVTHDDGSVKPLDDPENDQVDIGLAPDGVTFSAGGRLYDVETGERLGPLPVPRSSRAIAWLDGRHVLAKAGEHYYVVDVSDGTKNMVRDETPPGLEFAERNDSGRLSW